VFTISPMVMLPDFERLTAQRVMRRYDLDAL
jgi:hypothetical protein